MKGPLENIERKNYFTTPDGYFEDLPMKIQNQVSGSDKVSKPFWIPVLRYAIPVLFVGLLTFQFFRTAPTEQNADLLVSISSEEAIEYLVASDLGITEIIPEVFADTDIDELIKAPSAEEEYALTEDLLYTPDWNMMEDFIEVEDI